MYLRIFAAELVGTFGLLVVATGSIVYNDITGGVLGTEFIAAMHLVGLAILIFVFGRYSMAHFNPAVTICLWISGYTETKKLLTYLVAQLIGAFAGSLTVRYVLGDHAGLGYNFPDYTYGTPIVYGVEILATVFLMGAILLVVGSKRGPLLTGLVIAIVISLDVYFFGPISGASMNPIRSLAPAAVIGNVEDLWLYWTAPFIGSVLVALVFKKRFGYLAKPVI